MIRLRHYIIALTLTLAVLFGLGRIEIAGLDPANTPAVLFVMNAALVALLIAWDRLARLSPALLSGIMIVWYLLTKTWAYDADSSWAGAYTYITIAEAILASLSILLAQRISWCLHEFEDAVANVTIGDASRIKTLEAAEDDIAVEMARARRHERPLTVTVIAFDGQSIEGSLHRIVRELQQSMIQRYVMSGLARIVAQKTRRGDIVVQDPANNRVIILSPEASPHQIESLAARLQAAADHALGVPVRFGTAGFPHSALTFDDLVAQASEGAGRSSATQPITTPRLVESTKVSPMLYPAADAARALGDRDAYARVQLDNSESQGSMPGD